MVADGLHLHIALRTSFLSRFHFQLNASPKQCSLEFSKVCVHIEFLLCNIYQDLSVFGTTCTKLCAKAFFEGTFLCAPRFLVCARHAVCVHAHAHSLEGTLVPSLNKTSLIKAWGWGYGAMTCSSLKTVDLSTSFPRTKTTLYFQGLWLV